ncbi:MAG: hypothetical protein ABI672_17245, partial [Vicinamibacteria bacterium]
MSSRVPKPGTRTGVDVLIVDADRARAEALAIQFEADGLSTQVAQTVEDASARSGDARVLLVRRRVGASDGFAFVRALRKKTEVPSRVLILGDGPNADDALRAIDVSALGIVFEPYSSGNLIRRVRKGMETGANEFADGPDAQVYRIRRGGVVFKMKSRPELLVDYLL